MIFAEKSISSINTQAGSYTIQRPHPEQVWKFLR
jgi:hypothetical protein